MRAKFWAWLITFVIGAILFVLEMFGIRWIWGLELGLCALIVIGVHIVAILGLLGILLFERHYDEKIEKILDNHRNL